MSVTITIPEDVKEKIIEDHEVNRLSYPMIMRKYGYKLNKIKELCQKKKSSEVIPRDLLPREFSGEYFNWDFEAF